MTLRGPSPIDVFWHNTIASVPRALPTLILGHEFLDALPIQKFQYTKKGWREILVDLKEHLDWDEGDVYKHPLQQAAPSASSASSALSASSASSASSEASNGPIEFKEVLCPHNNLAATAMLGGLFEGEHVEQNVSRGESGTSSGASRS